MVQLRYSANIRDLSDDDIAIPFNFMLIKVEEVFQENPYVCLNKKGACWIEMIEDNDVSRLQQDGAIFKQAKTPDTIASFIKEHQPQTFLPEMYWQVSNEKFANIPMYTTPTVTASQGKCTLAIFRNKHCFTTDSGNRLMRKLQEWNPELYHQLLDRGKADLSNFVGNPPKDHLNAFYDWTKKYWK